jgi:hypothetical protein
MKAKRFSQFIRESVKPYRETGGIKIWFDSDTNFTEVLSQGIWQLHANDTTELEIFKMIEQLEKDLNITTNPIILIPRGASFLGNFSFLFSVDSPVETEEMYYWSTGASEISQKSIDIFKSNASGVDSILNRGGRNITGEQLLQLLGWINSQELSRNYLVDITDQIKAHPNWPGDVTDWALGDW